MNICESSSFRNLKYSFLFILLATSLPTLTKELICTKYKKFPIILNVCEGEGPCGNLESSYALLPIDIHEKPSKHSKIVDTLERIFPPLCERISDLTYCF